MKETQVTAKIVEGLNREMDCFAQKRHSGKFGSGDPDISGCFRGRGFHIETKVVGGELTELQAVKLDSWRIAGSATRLAIYNPESKIVKLVHLDDSENWSMFTGFPMLKKLYAESVGLSAPLRNFPYQSFLSDIEL